MRDCVVRAPRRGLFFELDFVSGVFTGRVDCCFFDLVVHARDFRENLFGR